MPYLKIKITGIANNDQPGFVFCSFRDASNQEWNFIEKIPIVSKEDLDEKSIFPLQGIIPVTIKKVWANQKGKKIITIDAFEPLGIATLEKKSLFDIPSEQIIYEETRKYCD